MNVSSRSGLVVSTHSAVVIRPPPAPLLLSAYRCRLTAATPGEFGGTAPVGVRRTPGGTPNPRARNSGMFLPVATTDFPFTKPPRAPTFGNSANPPLSWHLCTDRATPTAVVGGGTGPGGS